MQALERKLTACGGRLIKFSTYTTKLSQTCVCGRQAKKQLSQRTHNCVCGILGIDRDLFSAFLARFVLDGGRLDVNGAATCWVGSERSLVQATSDWNNRDRVNRETGATARTTSPKSRRLANRDCSGDAHGASGCEKTRVSDPMGIRYDSC